MRVLLNNAYECKEYDDLSLYPNATRGVCSNEVCIFKE
jgi:hypothetical protein